MKILYVNPGRIEAGLDAVIKGPPLALLAIAAMVPEHEATLFDFKVDFYEERAFRKLLRAHQVVAITSMTPQIYHALEVAQMAKEEGCITIIGGYHPTLDPDHVAIEPAIDFTVRGEGEHTFKEICDFIDGNRNHVELSSILGVSYKDEMGRVVHNPDRPLEPNLDVFPIPRREMLKSKKYLYLGTRVMLMETSRGCPHNCEFCCIIKMWRDQEQHMVYRTKSLRRIMEELYTIDLGKWDFIFFNDDNFTINVKRTDKILDLLIKSGLSRKIFFSCQSRVDTFTQNPWLAPKMAKAGFRQVFFGIESVHQQSLDAMGKHTNVEMIQTAVRMATENGISIFGGMIIGFPGETKEMVRENVDFAISLNMDFVQFTPITAFPGTKFFEDMQAKGMVSTRNYKYYNLFQSMMRTEQLTRNEMYHLVGEAYSRYYISTRFIKLMAQRVFTDPKFKWYAKIAFPWIKQVIFGGWGMFRSMGITWEMANNVSQRQTTKWLKNPKVQLKERYERFQIIRLYLARLRVMNQKIRRSAGISTQLTA